MFFHIKEENRPAIISSDGIVLSYAELAAKIKQVGEYLTARKLAFCLCENRPYSLVGYLSFLNADVVPLLLDKKIDRNLLNTLLTIYHPDYIYLPEDMDNDIAGYTEIFEIGNYILLSSEDDDEKQLYDDLALLLNTSGSTGSPKLVRQSYKNIQANAESIAKYLDLNCEERPITTLPMNYTYGLSIINSHLQVGATIVMTDLPMNMKAFWDFVNEQGVTSFGGVPFTYQMLKKARFFKLDIPSLRYMTQAGGKLDAQLHYEYAEWSRNQGKKFIVMYGQTEATARMAYLPAEYSVEKAGSIGFAIPGGEFVLIDAEGKEIDCPDKEGELVYKGDNVTLGYAEQKSDLAKGDERNGVLETGDIAKRDADGFYYIVGRKKRFLKVFGNRVNLDEIDRLIQKEFKDVECATVGTDDHVKTYVNDSEILQDVKKFLSATTHLSESAFEVIYVETIPKNEAGKILYSKLDN